ncbi:MAG: O-methyltransferase [Bacilli bacterium]|nr:O-methyltransferase [Bacilli bacterium]
MDRMVEQLEKYAIEFNIPIIQKDGLNFIIDYIKNNNVKTILEIGSAIGYSAINFALVNKNIKVTTIERDIERYNEAIKNIKDFNLEEQIKIFNVDAFDYNDETKYDLIFIDAAKAQYIKFFEKFKNNLKDNGIIISDNLSFHGLVENPKNTNNRNTKQLVSKISKYIEFLKDNKEFNTTFYKLGDGISISKKI